MNLKQYLLNKIDNAETIDRCLTIIGSAKQLRYLDFLEVCNKAISRAEHLRAKEYYDEDVWRW